MIVGEHRTTLLATTSLELTAMVDAHRAELLRELALVNSGELPALAEVYDCSGTRVVINRPAWAPDREQIGQLSMAFDVKRSRANNQWRADVCMALSEETKG